MDLFWHTKFEMCLKLVICSKKVKGELLYCSLSTFQRDDFWIDVFC